MYILFMNEIATPPPLRVFMYKYKSVPVRSGIGLLGPIVNEIGGDRLGNVVVPLIPYVVLEHL